MSTPNLQLPTPNPASRRFRSSPGRRRLATTVVFFLAAATIVSAQERSPGADPGQPPSMQKTEQRSTSVARFARWIDLQAVQVNARYRWLENSAGRELLNQLQLQEQVRGRVKLDEQGRYSIHAGLSTGGALTSGWNSTGAGTGTATAKLYLKQLFGSAEPIKGVELQYGSLYALRGESTEITSYDNDIYLSGGRLLVRRPEHLFFDEVAVSVAYLGDPSTPNVFRRLESFGRENLRQLLLTRRLGPATLSTEYTDADDDGRLRQGLRWTVPHAVVTGVRVEYGVRVTDAPHDTAFAAAMDFVLNPLRLQAGYAHVDPSFAVLNGDRYGAGNRVFTGGSIPLGWDVTVAWFATKQIDPPSTAPNDKRAELLLQWNALQALTRLRN
jgi:hypothetical protein